MDFEKIREVVQKAKEGAPNKESALLVEGFEEFLAMYEIQKGIQDPREKLIHAEKLDASRNKVWALLEQTAASFGLNMEQFQRYMDNASNFSPQQWQAMETFKEEQLKIKKRTTAPLMRRQKKNRELLKA